MPAVGVAEMLRDARLSRIHQAMLPPPRRPRVDPIDVVLLAARTKIEEAETLEGALAELTKPELAVALGDPNALEGLRRLDGSA